MNTEYEIRVLEIDKEKLIKKLEELGAEFKGDNEQKRYVYDTIPKEDGKWIRLRTNGKRCFLARSASVLFFSRCSRFFCIIFRTCTRCI